MLYCGRSPKCKVNSPTLNNYDNCVGHSCADSDYCPVIVHAVVSCPDQVL